MPRGTVPIPVVLMNSPSQLPFSTTFVSPVTMATPAAAGRLSHRCGHAAQRCHRKSLGNDKGRAQIERRGAPHGEVVHSAMHRERTDIAAGEEQRFDNE